MILERLKRFFMRPLMQNDEHKKIALRFHKSPLNNGDYFADFYVYVYDPEKTCFIDSMFVGDVLDTFNAIYKADIVLSPPMEFPYFEGTGPFGFISGILEDDEIICCWDEKYVLVKKERTGDYFVIERHQDNF